MSSPSRRASGMTVGTAFVVLQMSETPVIFGCAEAVAKRLCRVTAGGPAVAVEIKSDGKPGNLMCSSFALTEYGQEVKKKLEGMICLSVK